MTIDLKELFHLPEDLDERMVGTILKAIKEAHQDGFDYLKFKHSVKNLEEMNMDQLTAMKSAYSTASTLGVSKNLLLNSIGHYMVALKKEREEFAITHKKNLDTRVNAPKVEEARLAKMKIENQKKIDQLTKENNMIDQKMLSIQEEIASNESKIEETRQEFLKVYTAFQQAIEEDKSMIDQIL